MQVRICSPLRIFHEKPMGPAGTMIVLAIYFGLLSIQRTTNACWQAVWCGVIFNWEAGSPSPLPRAQGGEGRMNGARLAIGCHCERVDSSRSEQLETMLLAIVLIIIATFGGCLLQANNTWLCLLVCFQPHKVVTGHGECGEDEYISYSLPP